MLDMQNVKTLAITEGDVRTIHDSTGNLLWGKLTYSTKYAGDTYQQTYSGKNLIDSTNLTYIYANSPSQIELFTIDGGIRMVNNGGASQDRFAVFKSVDLTPYAGTVVRMKATFGTGGGIRLYRIASDGSGRTQQATTTTSDNEISFTVPADLGTSNYLGYVLDVPTGGGTIVDFTNLIMTIDESLEPFEPYTGGIPAPNPDYPQPIQVVTGEQTVNISDGETSRNYTLDLGSIELCKISDYQDYIYKSGDDWYVHKEIANMVLDGTNNAMTGVYVNGITQDYNFCTKIINDMKVGAQVGYCSYLTASTGSPYGVNKETIFFGTTSNEYLYMGVLSSRTGGLRTLPAFNTYLETHPATIYYAVATPTDTKITDATLLSQLDAIEEWMTRYGYTSTITGNLPIIITQTNLE